MELVTDWIRACVEGATADGRNLSRPLIEQMDRNYDPAVYNARIWPEHIRGITADSQFKALGDVVATKSEVIRSGALSGKMGLYVKLAPHPELVGMVRNGQKVHLSVEIDPSFSDSNEAYLVGIGVTDSPASLGTTIMKFSNEGRDKNLFSTAIEINQEPAISSPEKIEYC